jgi:serine/threonine-protein kinase
VTEISVAPRKIFGDHHHCVQADAVRKYTQKILQSSAFSKSARMCRFLQFVVKAVLDGRSSEIKEYVIGIEIFDRTGTFDPRIDPIVRVEARRLRSKLKTYYESDGSSDPIVIELPIGTYVPLVRQREGSCADLALVRPDSRHPLVAERVKNITVLPFTTLGPEPDAKYFSEGLTEAVAHALTKIEGLRVVAETSATSSNGTDIVLTGSVRRSGGRMRIVVSAIDTVSGYYLWSETYDRHTADPSSMQEEISRVIVATVRTHHMHTIRAARLTLTFDQIW